uniref:Putative mucin-17 n=1 Tax=Lutzomyia longipalpis TaxID=7200 RepID=A0A1B0CPX6_LUTLO
MFVGQNQKSMRHELESRKLFGGYRITPKFCKPSKSLPKDDIRAHGPTICMFNHECTQRQGQVVGACMDGIDVSANHLNFLLPFTSRFLFGTCCQLQGSVDSPLTPPTDELDDRPITNQAISQSYETYGNHILPGNAPYNEIKIQDRPATTPDSAQKFTSHYYVNNEAVVVSSPSSVHKASTYMPMTSSSTHPRRPQRKSVISTCPWTQVRVTTVPKSPQDSHHHSAQLSQPPRNIYLQMNYVTNSLLDNNFNTHFTHSDITHPGADADLLGDDDAGYARPSDFTSAGTFISSPTPKPSTKNTPPKPEFKPKPKPTTASPNKYVLVHTISNDKPSAKPTIGENDMESIESIILMLNETNTGPQYNAASTPEDRETTFYTTRYPVSIKTKKPATKKPPSTSYVSSTVAVTPRPGATTTKKGTKRPSGGTKVTQKPPSTSYVYSSQPTKRPTSVTVSTSPQKFQTSPPPLLSSTTPTVIVLSPFDPSSSTLPPEQIIQSKPIEQEFYNEDDTGYGQISVTQRPSPTVVITPKPALGSSPWPQQSRPTKPPSTSYSCCNQETNSAGYTTIWAINMSKLSLQRPFTQPKNPDGIYNYIQTQTDYNNNAVYAGSTLPYPEISTIKEDYLTPQDDLVNFPPVRNPNLNTSLNYPGAEEEEEVVTPTFLEDQKFKDKMDLLVSKIVASLQSNFDSLADVVLERNTTNVIQKRPTAKPGVASSKPPTRKPTPKPPQRTTVPPLGVTSRRPPTKPVATGATRPGVTTRKPTARPGQITSSRPTRKPTTTLLTTRRPTQKVTTTVRPTTRPTKRIKTTTVLSTTNAEDYDTEDVGEEQDGETSTPVTDDDGRIRCGIRPHVKSARIVGGKSAHFGEFPWQVLVRESTWLGLFTKNKCGGVLISNSYVITAAHCQPGFLASLVAVFGEYDISGEVESKRSVTKNVKRVIVHRQYDAATFENDLAILELESPIHYDTHIVPVCMPPDNADFTGRMATVTGWGRLKYGGGVPSVLQEVHVPIIDNSVCQEMFQTAGHNKKILKSFLCAGYANGQKDSCEGDSGGPLVLQRPDGRWELAGTVSHGIKCAAPYLPGVYMRTTFYKPWLQSVTGVH